MRGQCLDASRELWCWRRGHHILREPPPEEPHSPKSSSARSALPETAHPHSHSAANSGAPYHTASDASAPSSHVALKSPRHHAASAQGHQIGLSFYPGNEGMTEGKCSGLEGPSGWTHRSRRGQRRGRLSPATGAVGFSPGRRISLRGNGRLNAGAWLLGRVTVRLFSRDGGRLFSRFALCDRSRPGLGWLGSTEREDEERGQSQCSDRSDAERQAHRRPGEAGRAKQAGKEPKPGNAVPAGGAESFQAFFGGSGALRERAVLGSGSLDLFREGRSLFLARTVGVGGGERSLRLVARLLRAFVEGPVGFPQLPLFAQGGRIGPDRILAVRDQQVLALLGGRGRVADITRVGLLREPPPALRGQDEIEYLAGLRVVGQEEIGELHRVRRV